MLVYLLFRIAVFIIGIVPFPILFLLSDIICFFVYRILGYRKKVVRQNLENAFPEKSAHQRLLIEQKFYKHLFDSLLESIKGFSMSKSSLLERQKLLREIPKEMLREYPSIIILGGHYGNWEWGGISAAFHVDTDVVILYSPIKNKYIDNYIKKSRETHQTYFWSSTTAALAFRKYQNKTAAFVMIADQSPSSPKRAHWVDFLQQPTGFLRGPASYAKNYNIPVLYIDIQRVKRGYYTMDLEVLTANPEQSAPEEITALYAQKLEEKIKMRPELWLWSHRRWKHQPPT